MGIMDVSGKSIIVTGDTQGIGLGIVRALIQNGATQICIADVNEEHGYTLSDELNRQGAETIFVRTDISNSSQVQNMVFQTVNAFGKLDVLVNNAGISHIGLFTDMTPAEWNHVLDVNLGSVLNCTHLAVPAMVSEKDGVILNISSMWGEVGASCEAVYSASKGGINAISCGVIDTEMNACFSEDERQALADEIPLMRFGQPEEVAELAVFLADQKASFLTGKIITLDGGML